LLDERLFEQQQIEKKEKENDQQRNRCSSICLRRRR